MRTHEPTYVMEILNYVRTTLNFPETIRRNFTKCDVRPLFFIYFPNPWTLYRKASRRASQSVSEGEVYLIYTPLWCNAHVIKWRMQAVVVSCTNLRPRVHTRSNWYFRPQILKLHDSALGEMRSAAILGCVVKQKSASPKVICRQITRLCLPYGGRVGTVGLCDLASLICMFSRKWSALGARFNLCTGGRLTSCMRNDVWIFDSERGFVLIYV